LITGIYMDEPQKSSVFISDLHFSAKDYFDRALPDLTLHFIDLQMIIIFYRGRDEIDHIKSRDQLRNGLFNKELFFKKARGGVIGSGQEEIAVLIVPYNGQEYSLQR
jgi:hypothetical protein